MQLTTKNSRAFNSFISLGYFCSVASDLEKLGLRKESSPFDWTISEFKGVISAIQNNFSGYLAYESLAQNKNNRKIYKNINYGIEFFHDFNKYIPLRRQLTNVQEKYNRRIARFYKTITSPTLFIRYISDEDTIAGHPTELNYIENNYNQIRQTLKKFNQDNDIIFIANEGVVSHKFTIYNVPVDRGDIVSRSPLFANPTLHKWLNDIDIPEKQANIQRYANKELQKSNKYLNFKHKVKSLLARLLAEYCHERQY